MFGRLSQFAKISPIDRQNNFAECQLKESPQTPPFFCIPVCLFTTVAIKIPFLTFKVLFPLDISFVNVAPKISQTLSEIITNLLQL